jgi:hypothetical protein
VNEWDAVADRIEVASQRWLNGPMPLDRDGHVTRRKLQSLGEEASAELPTQLYAAGWRIEAVERYPVMFTRTIELLARDPYGHLHAIGDLANA